MPQSSPEVGLVKHASKCDSGLSPCFENCLAQAGDLSAAKIAPLVSFADVWLISIWIYLAGCARGAVPLADMGKSRWQ